MHNRNPTPHAPHASQNTGKQPTVLASVYCLPRLYLQPGGQFLGSVCRNVLRSCSLHAGCCLSRVTSRWTCAGEFLHPRRSGHGGGGIQKSRSRWEGAIRKCQFRETSGGLYTHITSFPPVTNTARVAAISTGRLFADLCWPRWIGNHNLPEVRSSQVRLASVTNGNATYWHPWLF